MLMVIPDEGKMLWLYWALATDGSDLEDFVCDLFQSNTTVVDASSGADFTIATFTGYAQVAVPRTSFGAPSIVAHVANITSTPSPTFTSTNVGSQLCYGWILRGALSGKIIAGQNFDAPRDMSGGTTETLDPFTFKFKTFA